jgi:hypothetical protein
MGLSFRLSPPCSRNRFHGFVKTEIGVVLLKFTMIRLFAMWGITARCSEQLA